MSAHVLLVVAVLSAGTSGGVAQSSSLDYPQWRGQNRDGSASAFTQPTSWPETLTRKWKVDVGEGYATPLVIGDTVYVFTRRAEREVVTALDAMSGAERWHSDYPAEYSPSEAVAVHGAGPKATPLFHEAKLFTLGISGIVSAFDATTGKLVWQTAPPKEPPYFSAASSPLGVEGIVLAHPGNYGPLTAFDSDTGEVKWTAGNDGGFIVSPIAVTLGGTRQIITATQDSVIGVSLGGDVLWRSPWDGGGGSTTPVVYNDIIIVSALDKGVAAILPILHGATWTAETVWHTKDVSMYISNPVVVEGTLFGLSRRNRGQFFALDAKSGEVLWLGPPREADNTAFVKAGDLIFMLNDDAELIVGKANRSMFEALKRYTVADSPTWATTADFGKPFLCEGCQLVGIVDTQLTIADGERPTMKRDLPPVVATLLLERLGHHDDSVIGDLAEEWCGGRSAAWYWRQVLSIIVATAIRDSRAFLSALLLVAASVFAEPLIVSPPAYSVRVMDAHTGKGVAGLRITTDNGIVCYTLLNGDVSWGESSLMGRPVRFTIQDETRRFDGLDATLRVARGGKATLTVNPRKP